ncbi:uncharacterized protein LOC119098926 [Pollicipes pollicipes]|uniref:uncharacterized protein LOC119098926 n=1 Tax=Pollicipes pollicipes TaxID=41117 RepID=UPI0018852448|nr:uncharacterized protein LOC119098926 [Pollicipes pollicipes]
MTFAPTSQATNITDPNRKKALLLHYAGEAVHDIFDALPTTADENGTDSYGSTRDVLTSHFSPKRNLQFEVYTFQSAHQENGETLDQFATRLRIFAKRIPFHTRKALEKELHSLQEQDIIEPVTGPTPWVSPVVCVPKPKDLTAIRVCVDMRRVNTAIQRETPLQQ